MAKNTTTKPKTRRPRILVLEALTGSSRCIIDAGGRPLTANPRQLQSAVDALNADWDGLLLTGGGDVDPRLYGQKPHAKVYGVNETRDKVELAALAIARERGVPVMGICRGAQLLNVEAGGSLKQHITGHYGRHHARSGRNSLLREVAGPDMLVVSYHHQAIGRTAHGFRQSGHAPDGCCEAIESTDGRCLGVQFHPEQAPTFKSSRALFRWLVSESAKRAGMPVPARPKARKAPAAVPSSKPGVKSIHQPPRARGYTVSWLCPHCAIRFDHQSDRDDHVRVLHEGQPLLTR